MLNWKDNVRLLVLVAACIALLFVAVSKLNKKRKTGAAIITIVALSAVILGLSIPSDYDLLVFGDHHDQVEFLERETKSFVGEDGTYTLRFVAYNRETKRLEFCVVLPSEDERVMFRQDNFQVLRSDELASVRLLGAPSSIWGKHYQSFWLEDVQSGEVVTLTLFGVSQSWTIP